MRRSQVGLGMLAAFGRGGRRDGWRARLAVQLGLRPDDDCVLLASPAPHARKGRPDPEPKLLRRPFSLVVARTVNSALVTARGPLDSRHARWLQEVVLDLIEAEDILDVAVELRHAVVADDATLAEVAAIVAASAERCRVIVTVRPPTLGAWPGLLLSEGESTASEDHSRPYRLVAAPKGADQFRERDVRPHPPGPGAAPDADRWRGGDSFGGGWLGEP